MARIAVPVLVLVDAMMALVVGVTVAAPGIGRAFVAASTKAPARV